MSSHQRFYKQVIFQYSAECWNIKKFLVGQYLLQFFEEDMMSMKRVWVVVTALGILTIAVLVAVLSISVIEHGGKEKARSEILAAIDRMRYVKDFDDIDELLKACESGALDQRIDCRLGDYDVVYRGHRIKFSRIEVDYYRLLHGAFDRERGRYLPYMTGTARIERRPNVRVMTIGH